MKERKYNTMMVSRIGNFDFAGKVRKVVKKPQKKLRLKIREDKSMSEDTFEEFAEPTQEDVTEALESSVEDIPEFDDLPDMAEQMQKAEKYNVIEDAKVGRSSIKVAFVGAGQAGCNLVDTFWGLGYRRCLAINTAIQDMNALKMDNANQYVLEGYNGAGKNPKVGMDAIKKHYEDVLRRFHKCLGKKVEHIMICVGGGGGTGTGSASVLVDIAKDYFKEIEVEAKIGVIVTTPEKTEKGSIKKNAEILVGNLNKRCEKGEISPLIIVSNQQISKFFPNESIVNFYPKSNKIVGGIFDRFNTITAYGSPIGHNVDRADLQSLLNGGLMTYGQCRVNEIVDDSSLSEAMIKNIKNTLLCPGFDLTTATNACCLIVASSKELNKITKDAVNKAVESLTRLFVNEDVKIHLGIYKANTQGISICTAVSGVKEIKGLE